MAQRLARPLNRVNGRVLASIGVRGTIQYADLGPFQGLLGFPDAASTQRCLRVAQVLVSRGVLVSRRCRRTRRGGRAPLDPLVRTKLRPDRLPGRVARNLSLAAGPCSSGLLFAGWLVVCSCGFPPVVPPPGATPLSVGLPVTGSPFGGAGSAVTLLPGAVGGVTVGWVKTGAVTTTLNRAAEVNNVFRMCITSQIEPWATGLLFPAIQYPCWGCYGRAGIVKVAERPGEIDRARAAQQLLLAAVDSADRRRCGGYGPSSFCGEAAVVLASVKDARRLFAVAFGHP